MPGPIEFTAGDRYQHSSPDTPTVIVARQENGAWSRIERGSGRIAGTVGPGRTFGHETADDWVRYLIGNAGFVKMEDKG